MLIPAGTRITTTKIASVAKAGVTAMGAHRPESHLRAVEFRVRGGLIPGARCVCLVAGFNRWDPRAHQMQRGPEGDWTVVVHLPPGVHPYLFLVDGAWWNDPGDDGRAPSEWGNEYSLKLVR